MNRLAHFNKYQTWYEVGLLCLYLFINGSILATSKLMEAYRHNDTPSMPVWQPFVEEYSSALGLIALFPAVLWLLKKVPLGWQGLKQTIPIYLLASVFFSLVHVGIMVGLRKVIFWSQSRHYDFGNVPYELFYEYRKDLWTFIFVIAVIKSYQFIVSRLRGEANPIAEGEDVPPDNNSDRLLVKKLGKEFIIRVEDIEWLEAAGNYVNLHLGGRIYPTRSTLGRLIEQLEAKGFCRIHRSYGVNLNAIDSITPLSSGDSEIKLVNGTRLNLSRRYKDNLKSQLH